MKSFTGVLWCDNLEMDRFTITREQLYQQVWSTPCSKLAAGYGISDVALAKICKKLNVPRPGLGYWARLALSDRRLGRATQFCGGHNICRNSAIKAPVSLRRSRSSLTCPTTTV